MKNKIKLTSDEVVILKNIDKKYKYIARNNDGSLTVHRIEPKKNDEPLYIHRVISGGGWQPLYLFFHLFQNITFESGAHLIADLIKENEK